MNNNKGGGPGNRPPSTTKKRILAIDPGTRYLGMALLEGDALVYYGVKRIHHRGSPHERLTEGKRVVAELIRDLDPDLLAYEKTFIAKNRNTALLNVLADEIVSLAERQGLEVVGVAPSTVKKRVTGNGRASKREVAEAVAAIYPELRAYLPNGKGSAFRSNLFDAVAVALVA